MTAVSMRLMSHLQFKMLGTVLFSLMRHAASCHSGATSCWLSHASVTGLLIKMRKCIAHRICGDREHAVERPVHFHNKEYGAGDG
jgi:hypothetical protein